MFISSIWGLRDDNDTRAISIAIGSMHSSHIGHVIGLANYNPSYKSSVAEFFVVTFVSRFNFKEPYNSQSVHTCKGPFGTPLNEP